MRESETRHFPEFGLNPVADFMFFAMQGDTRGAHHHLLVKSYGECLIRER
jgi:hypothetical protein